MTLASSPTLNSAGQTRFPTFSIIKTSMSCSGSSERPERTMFASRWHSPPKPGSVFTCTNGTWKRASRSASSVVCTSPSKIPRRSLPRKRSSVRSSNAVFPAPGELIKFITQVPARSNLSRLARASASLASRTPSKTTFTAVRCTLYTSSNSRDSTSNSSPLRTSKSKPPHAPHCRGKFPSRLSAPHSRHTPTAGTSSISNSAPSTGVPSATSSKLKAKAEGTTWRRWPTFTRTFVIRRPFACRLAIWTTESAIASSCKRDNSSKPIPLPHQLLYKNKADHHRVVCKPLIRSPFHHILHFLWLCTKSPPCTSFAPKPQYYASFWCKVRLHQEASSHQKAPFCPKRGFLALQVLEALHQ